MIQHKRLGDVVDLVVMQFQRKNQRYYANQTRKTEACKITLEQRMRHEVQAVHMSHVITRIPPCFLYLFYVYDRCFRRITVPENLISHGARFRVYTVVITAFIKSPM